MYWNSGWEIFSPAIFIVAWMCSRMWECLGLTLYTDGGASPNPGKGGWAAVLIEGDEVVGEVSGGEADTSNNRMELMAAIKGLECVGVGGSVVVVTDSNYLRLGITQWIVGWKRNGWRTANRKPVKNQDLWQVLDEVVQGRNVAWSWVKGHSGDRWNDYVDEMVWKAREAI